MPMMCSLKLSAREVVPMLKLSQGNKNWGIFWSRDLFMLSRDIMPYFLKVEEMGLIYKDRLDFC